MSSAGFRSGAWLAAVVLATRLPAQTAVPAAPDPYAAMSLRLAKASVRVDAGGFVVAEVDPTGPRYFTVGDAAPREGVPSEKVIFEIGSITKVFTGLLLAQAVVEHKVALNDPIGRYLPADIGLSPATAAITLEQLATHTAGFPADPPNLRSRNVRDPYAGYVAGDLYVYLSFYRPPGPLPLPARYTNVGAGLLGHILAGVYGETYDALLAEKITGPLGLPDTVVALNDEQKGRLAVPHIGFLPMPAVAIADPFEGAMGLHSTAADLARFAAVLLAPGDHPLRAAWELASQPRHAFPAYGGQIGLGVMLMPRADGLVYWHGGTTRGVRSHLEWSPATHHAEVVLLNDDSIDAMNRVVTLYQLVPPAAASK